ncbi:phosphotransferase family protein [Georgenia sp. SYP-B2076]|uniref:phosphotransferase family protein n=1 Tax=Georgenia sp. SYP-B2076 TaxID=2495881 RepID=UPI000F8EB854|nr:phosphotransferase family protein [Georgenia sp. SYP-B2076]
MAGSMIVGGVDLERAGQWLDSQGLPSRITEPRLLGGGSQNVVISLVLDGRRLVLRHPPLRGRQHSNRAIAREMRVLRALSDTDLPTPRFFAGTDDLEVLGAAFYLMEEVDGFNPVVELPEVYRSDPTFPSRAGLSMATTLAQLGALDPDALGIGDEGRPEGFLQRQVDKQLALWKSFHDDPRYDRSWLGDVEGAARWLTANRPAETSPGITHGDYHFNNVLLGKQAPEVTAILDWEMVTIGDPLLDLAWLLLCWPHDGQPSYVPSGGDLIHLSALPSRRQLAEAYAQHSNRDIGSLDWYVVLACFKWSILFETTYLRSQEGKAPRDIGDTAHEVGRELMRTAQSLMSGEATILE